MKNPLGVMKNPLGVMRITPVDFFKVLIINTLTKNITPITPKMHITRGGGLKIVVSLVVCIVLYAILIRYY